MKIVLKYFRPLDFGSSITITLEDIDIEQTTVQQLKRKVAAKIHLLPQLCKMSVHIDGEKCCTEMSNEELLSKYVDNVCNCDQMVINLEQLGEQ